MTTPSKKKKKMLGLLILIVVLGGLFIYFTWFTTPPPLAKSTPPFSPSFPMAIFNNPKFKKLKIFGDLPVKLENPESSTNPFAEPVLLN